MHEQTSLSALALLLAAAVACGLLMNRVRMPAAAGFILVGMALGPTGAGLIQTSENIEMLAELGVLMLLFIIGMEMRLSTFAKSLPLALGITGATCFIIPVSVGLFTWAVHGEVLGGIIIGFMLSISSTAVAIKMIEDNDEKETPAGRLALAILVAQDLAVVPLLLITEHLGRKLNVDTLLTVGGKMAIAFAILAVFIHVLNKVKSFRFPASEFLMANLDVGTLGVLGICFASAALSGYIGLSPALGAFLGGMAVGHSTLRRGALMTAQPVESILLFIFFLSVGLLIDLEYLVQHAWIIVAALVVVTGGKTVLNFLLLGLMRQSIGTAFSTSLFLSPVGEFSFVLAGAGLAAGSLSTEGHKLAIAVIAMSLLASPIFFFMARQAEKLVRKMMGLGAPQYILAPVSPDLVAQALPGPDG
jgi:CPA2 family monovalent cation:H+ antiporter-2